MTHLKELRQFIISLIVLLLLPLAWRNEVVTLQWVGVGGALLLGASIIFASQRRSIALPTFSLPIIAFIGYQGFSLIFAPLPQYGVKLVLLNLALFILFLFFIQSRALGWTMNLWETVLLTVGGIIMAVELTPLFFWLLRWRQSAGAFFPLPPVSFTLPGILLTNPNVVAGFASLIVPLILVKLWRANHWQTKTGWSLLLTLFVIGTLFSHSRSGWLALLTGAGITLGALYLSHRKKPHWIIVPLAIVFAIISAQQLFFSGKQSFSNARGDIWRNAWILFTQSPIFGQGVGSFTPLYVVEAQSPPGYVVAHAHNFVLQLLAESGIIGLAIAAIGIWMLIRATLAQYRRTPPHATTRYHLLAFVGAGTALTVHHLGDYLLWHPLYTATIFLLTTLALTPLPADAILNLSPRWRNICFGLITMLYVGGVLWAGRGDSIYQKGLAAARADNWVSARENICAAAEKYPEKTLFGFQCALASMQVFSQNDDPSALNDAIAIQQQTFARDSYWVINEVNLALMLWQAKEYDDAKETMAHAVGRTPQNTIFMLNLGWMAEESGDTLRAAYWYERLLKLSPALATDVFFNQTPTRRKIATTVDPAINWASAGWDALDAGDFAAAEQIFSAAVAVSPKDAAAWAGLATAQRELGNPAAARTLATARLISPNHWRVVQMMAAFARANGDDARAAEILGNFFDNIAASPTRRIVYSRPYYFGAYNQVELPFDLLPQVQYPTFDVAMQPQLAWLTQYRKIHPKKDGTP